jgi:PTS system nitrogen regulatory IIA component
MLAINRIQCRAECTSKKKALETLAALVASSVPTLNSEDLFHHFITRERLGSTGLGQGIAIPHCRFATGGASICALMTLKTPIEFDSIDNQPVDIIFAMLVPENADNDHLQNLAHLAEALQNSDYTYSLRQATSNNALFNAAIAPFVKPT